MFSRISNSEATNFLNQYFLWFIFQLANWDRDSFGPMRKFVFFFNYLFKPKKMWKKFVNQIGESIWWIHYWPAESVSWWEMKKTCHYFSHVTSCIGVNLLWDRVCKSLRIFNEPFFNVYMSRQWICAYKAGYKYKRYCIINNICRSCIMYVLLYIWTYT